MSDPVPANHMPPDAAADAHASHAPDAGGDARSTPFELWRAIRAGLFTAAAICFVAALLAADRITSYNSLFAPRRTWAVTVLVALAVAAASRSLGRRAPVLAAGYTGTLAVVLLVVPWSGFATAGTGLGLRLPLLVVTAVLAALAAAVGVLIDRRDQPAYEPGFGWTEFTTATVLAIALPVAGFFAVRPVQDAVNTQAAPVSERVTYEPVAPTGAVQRGTRDADLTLGTPYGLVVTYSGDRYENQQADRRDVVALVTPDDAGVDNIRWTYARLGAQIAGSPVTDGDRVYLLYRDRALASVFDSETFSFTLVTLQTSTGEPVSEHTLDGSGLTLLDAYGDTVIVGSTERGFVTSLRVLVDGEERWSESAIPPGASTEGDCQINASITDQFSVLVVRSCTGDGRMSLRTLDHGQDIWSKPFTGAFNCPAKAFGTPSVIVLSTCDPAIPQQWGPGVELRGIDPATGEQLWSTPGVGGYYVGENHPFDLLSPSYSVAYHPALGIVAYGPNGLQFVDPLDGSITSTLPIEQPPGMLGSQQVTVAGALIVIASPNGLQLGSRGYAWVR